MVSVSTSRYVCDQARVEHITVRKTTDRRREVLIEVSALLSSAWMRQDVNLTVSLIVNGKVVKSDEFRSLRSVTPKRIGQRATLRSLGRPQRSAGYDFG
jgi:hypothetical protein